jgi:flavin prenyltransferase
MRVLVCVSGASGAGLGVKLFEALKTHADEAFLCLSDGAKEVLKREELKFFDDSEIWQGPASGSFGVEVTFVVPCSMNTLAKIACGIGDNLTTRAASVALKERKKLIIAPREMPIHQIHLEQMAKLSGMGVFIAPPMLAYYAQSSTLEDVERFLIGRWMDLAGIKNEMYKKWDNEDE